MCIRDRTNIAVDAATDSLEVLEETSAARDEVMGNLQRSVDAAERAGNARDQVLDAQQGMIAELQWVRPRYFTAGQSSAKFDGKTINRVSEWTHTYGDRVLTFNPGKEYARAPFTGSVVGRGQDVVPGRDNQIYRGSVAVSGVVDSYGDLSIFIPKEFAEEVEKYKYSRFDVSGVCFPVPRLKP